VCDPSPKPNLDLRWRILEPDVLQWLQRRPQELGQLGGLDEEGASGPVGSGLSRMKGRLHGLVPLEMHRSKGVPCSINLNAVLAIDSIRVLSP